MTALPYKERKHAALFPVFVFFAIALSAFGWTIQKVHAAGLAVTLSPASISVAATEITYSYTPSTQYLSADNDTVTITAPTGVTLALCAVPTTDADGDTTTDGSGAISGAGQIYTYTFSANTTVAATNGVDFCIEATPSAAGNYGISFTDTNTNYGSALLYAGSANQVTVTATVTPALAFVIRDSGDTTNTNTCALGGLTLVSVSSCAYRLKITTNATSGFAVQVNTDGDLRLSGSGNVADNLDLDQIGDAATVAAGTEGYGIALTPGSITGGTATASAAPINYSTNDSPLPISSATALYSASGTNNPSSTTYMSLITHRAAMDGDTSSGVYSHTVTYTVSASF